MLVGNGTSTDFWGDAWCGSTPLQVQFPGLYDISNGIGLSVAGIATRRWRLSFRRWLNVDLQSALHTI